MTAYMTAAESKVRRIRFWSTAHPRVIRLGKPQEHCDGIKWGTVALRDLYTYGDRPARGFQERSKCKNRGMWRFKALRSRDKWAHVSHDGVYCWAHLMQQMQPDAEQKSADAAWRRFLEKETK